MTQLRGKEFLAQISANESIFAKFSYQSPWSFRGGRHDGLNQLSETVKLRRKCASSNPKHNLVHLDSKGYVADIINPRSFRL
jgi:hypothetical protein